MKKEVEEEKGKGNNVGCSFFLRAYLFLAGGNLRRDLRGRFSRIFTSSPGVSSQGQGLHWLVSEGAFSHNSWFWLSPTWYCCFSGPGAEILLRPRCYLQGGKVTPRAMSLFPLPGTQVFCPGDPLLLAVNCLATVSANLSQFPYSTCQGIFLASYYSVSLWPHRAEDKYLLNEWTTGYTK